MASEVPQHTDSGIGDGSDALGMEHGLEPLMSELKNAMGADVSASLQAAFAEHPRRCMQASSATI